MSCVLKAASQSAELPTSAWSSLGGVDVFYPLQLEHARARLFSKAIPVEYCFKVQKLVEGPGLFRATVQDKEDAEYTLWLFPDGNGSYLDDVVLLNSFPNTSVWMKTLCWASRSGGNNLFIVKINGPTLYTFHNNVSLALMM